MLGHKILWESVARTPRHKSGLRKPSITEFGHAARIGVRDPITLNLPADASASVSDDAPLQR